MPPRVRLRSASWLLASRVLSAAITLPLNIVIARGLGAGGKGVYSMVTVAVSLAVTLLGFGLPSAIVYLSAREEIGPRGALKVASAVSVLTGLAAAIVSVIGAEWLSGAVFGTSSHYPVYATAAMVAPAMFVGFAVSLMMGVGRIRESTYVTLSLLAGQLVVASALLAAGMLRTATAVTGLLVLHVLVMGACALRLWQIREPEPLESGVLPIVRMGGRFGLINWIGNGLNTLSLRQDYLLLGYFTNPAQVGIYSVGTSLAELGWYIPGSMYGVLFPKVASEGAQSADTVARFTRVIVPLTLAIMLVVLGAAWLLVPTLFGADFQPATLVVALLIPGVVASVTGMMPSAYLAGIGKPGAGAISAGTNLVINVGLNIILMPIAGFNGAAIASSVSYTAGAAVMVYYFCRNTGMPLRALLVPSWAEISEILSALRLAILSRLRGVTGS